MYTEKKMEYKKKKLYKKKNLSCGCWISTVKKYRNNILGLTVLTYIYS